VTISTDYQNLLHLIKPYLAKGRSESASFLAWYFANYYRLEDTEAIDAVCDQPGDRGVDGIFLNPGEGTIDVFQSKINQKANATIGDSALREFAGTLTQFNSKAKIEELAASSKGNQLALLIERLKLIDHLGSYSVRGIFLSNTVLDENGRRFLSQNDNIFFIGSEELVSGFISDQKDMLKKASAKFDISGFSIATYVVDERCRAIIAPISANELVNLAGIQDQSLFSFNVRASLGKTQVNRDIQESIRDKGLHKMFPLFHNGVTVIAKKIKNDETSITVDEYFVINGCQSLNALYHNKSSLTVDLRLLTKFIELGERADLIDTITSFSNNQNGVKARDFKSNDRTQIRLQNEIARNYGTSFAFEIKRGEPVDSKLQSIQNEIAGIQLIAFDLKEPWTTHRKYQVFDERYSQVFGRPEVGADRIVLCYTLMQLIESRLDQLKNQLIAKYNLTKYAILYFLRRIFEIDATGRSIISNPENFVREMDSRLLFARVIGELIDVLFVDLNAETTELEDDFDYRGKMRDKDYVTKLGSDLLASYEKDIKRGKAKTLDAIWLEAIHK
jgi:AIPR protein